MVPVLWEAFVWSLASVLPVIDRGGWRQFDPSRCLITTLLQKDEFPQRLHKHVTVPLRLRLTPLVSPWSRNQPSVSSVLIGAVN